MKGNIPIPDLPADEEVWLVVAVLNVRENRTRQGKPYIDAFAANASGRIPLKIWQESMDAEQPFTPGLWGIQGSRSTFLDQTQFVVTRYRPITLETYREQQAADPPFPRAYTFDIETVALPEYRARVPHLLSKSARLAKMRIEQMERYAEDPEAEIALQYALGSLSSTSGRIVSIAVHVAPTPEYASAELDAVEHAFGISDDGADLGERAALEGFVELMKSFDPEVDELVGHNVADFDLPFVLQRCVVHDLPVSRLAALGGHNNRAIFDTMRAWGLGSRRLVGLDDLAWALGFESSKTEEVEGSRVFELFHAGKFREIREYNINDVRLTRKVYERLVRVYGR